MIAAREAEKYADIWALPEYGRLSPGANTAAYFLDIVHPRSGASVIDLGCGQGAGGKALAEKGFNVTYLDLVNVGSPEPFIEQSLWQPIPGSYDYGYCCDVMEHLPEPFTMLAARNMLVACGAVFFSISFTPDVFGAYLGEPLHLTVRPFTWWRDNLAELGELLTARDLIGEGVFYVRENG